MISPQTKRPPKRKTYHHGDLARALVAAAVAIIERRGADAITLREVASSVGVTHGAAYRHFEDKTALLAAVAEDGYRALVSRLLASATGDRRGPRARLEALAEAYVAFAMERPAHYRVMSGPRLNRSGRSPAPLDGVHVGRRRLGEGRAGLNQDGRFPDLEQAVQAAFGILVAEIARGQDEGVFRPGVPRDLAVAFWASGHGFADLVLHRRLAFKSTPAGVAYFGRLIAPLLDGLVRKRRHEES
jgi:AcrR family transcriptional regulator